MNKVTVLLLRQEKREHCGLCLEGGQKQHKHLQHIAALLHSFHLDRYGSLNADHSHNNEWRKQSEQIFVSCIRLTFYSEKKTNVDFQSSYLTCKSTLCFCCSRPREHARARACVRVAPHQSESHFCNCVCCRGS